jgi:ABC-type uncharacterized transport system substrate-binding protein
MIRRREVITLLGAAAVTWPLTARAQQPERVRRIGVLMALAADDPQSQRQLTAFVQGLQELGWTDGRNVRIDIRWAAGKSDRTRGYAAELLELGSEVMLASGGMVVPGVLQASRAVPIVFTLTPDPVGAGFVESLARPGGSATGFTGFEYGISAKWLELLKEIAPRVTRAIVLRDPTVPQGIGQFGCCRLPPRSSGWSCALSTGAKLTKSSAPSRFSHTLLCHSTIHLAVMHNSPMRCGRVPPRPEGCP